MMSSYTRGISAQIPCTSLCLTLRETKMLRQDPTHISPTRRLFAPCGLRLKQVDSAWVFQLLTFRSALVRLPCSRFLKAVFKARPPVYLQIGREYNPIRTIRLLNEKYLTWGCHRRGASIFLVYLISVRIDKMQSRQLDLNSRSV